MSLKRQVNATSSKLSAGTVKWEIYIEFWIQSSEKELMVKWGNAYSKISERTGRNHQHSRNIELWKYWAKTTWRKKIFGASRMRWTACREWIIRTFWNCITISRTITGTWWCLSWWKVGSLQRSLNRGRHHILLTNQRSSWSNWSHQFNTCIRSRLYIEISNQTTWWW